MRRDLQALEAGYDARPMRSSRPRLPPPSPRRLAILGAVLAVATSALVACGGGDDVVDSTTTGQGGAPPRGVSCEADPWSCPAGQGWWVAPDYAWRCQAEGAGAVGGACKAIIGEAACAAGLLCIGADPTKGTCSPFCSPTDKAHGCSAGVSCATVKFATPKGSTISASGCAP